MQDFSRFLQAKIPLDDRSLNGEVWRQLVHALGNKSSLDILDVGSGTGAMLRRLLEAGFSGSLKLTGLDCEPSLLQSAQIELQRQLTGKGYQIDSSTTHDMIAHRGERRIEFNAAAYNVDEYHAADGSYDLITAHAVMDLLPLPETLALFRHWLKPSGLVYCSINYDGETALFPRYQSPEFERQLLKAYDVSMENRRTADRSTGGAYCGRRLHQALLQGGFEIIAYGSSDWNITPINGRYRDQDALLLRCLLDWIQGEGRAYPEIDPDRLEHWREARGRQLQSGSLGIIIHQLDILARRI